MVTMGLFGIRLSRPLRRSREWAPIEHIALSGGLVVEIRGVIHEDRDLDLMIRLCEYDDERGEAREVCNDALEQAAHHPALEEMSSDAKLDPPAGAELEHLQFGPVTAAMMSGDDREDTTTMFVMMSLLMTIAMAVREVRTCDVGHHQLLRPERTKFVEESTDQTRFGRHPSVRGRDGLLY